MKVTFPDGWDIQSTDAEVFARSPDRQSKISVRRSALPSQPQTPKEYLEETLQRDDLENGELVRAGPYSGYLAEIVNPGTQNLHRSIAIIYKDGDIYLFEGENQNQNPPKILNSNSKHSLSLCDR